jgi:putative membrane protein
VLWRDLLFGVDPRSVGNDPDPSFSFANERTFLAWTRTALTLINVGLIFTQVLPPFQQRGTRLLIGLPLIVIGTITAAASLRRWAVNEQAIRLRRALPRSWLAPALTVVVTSVAPSPSSRSCCGVGRER